MLSVGLFIAFEYILWYYLINGVNFVNNKLSVILVEDDASVCQEFENFINRVENITLIKSTNSSSKAIEYVMDYLPDVVILDLELHYGSGNGLLFLKELRQLSLNPPPFILITTNNSSSTTYDYARQLGADFIMYKHQEGYSTSSVIDFLTMMSSVINNRKANVCSHINVVNETPQEKENRIIKRICTELDNVSISPKAVGYQYLVDAILMFIKQPIQNVCTLIGQKYGKTESSVERAMQNAICRAWSTADITDLLTHYTAKISSKKGVPTLTEFICYYANKIKNDY